jgi:hypothetical protein
VSTLVDYAPKPEAVRAMVNALLAEARAAETFPWTAYHVGLYRLIGPQMTNWLPAEEAAQLCRAFEMEMARLEAASC